MKSTSKKRTPSIVNLTVKRRYLTEREVERLMDCARKHGRYGHRDATMILVAYRHGLRASEVCDSFSLMGGVALRADQHGGQSCARRQLFGWCMMNVRCDPRRNVSHQGGLWAETPGGEGARKSKIHCLPSTPPQVNSELEKVCPMVHLVVPHALAGP